MTQVAKNLWMCGDYEVGENINEAEPAIVVSCIPAGGWEPDNLKLVSLHISFPFDDDYYLPNEQTLIGVVRLISDAMKLDKNVVVHCHAGLNRSGLVCALALIELGLIPEAAIKQIRLTRGKFALCNSFFERYVMSR